MSSTVPSARRRQFVLPVLALLLAAAGGVIAHVVYQFGELEASSAGVEIRQRTTALARARVIRGRARRAVLPEALLIANPTSPAEARLMVAYCDAATSSEVPALREVALRSDNALAAGNAIRALGRLRAIAKDPELTALLSDPRRRVRDETILALGESRDGSVVALLEPLVRGDDERSRLLATRALGLVGGERAHALLSAVLAAPAATREEIAFAKAGLGRASR